MLISQVVRALDTDPSAVIPEIALLMYEDAVNLANSLVHWPEGKGQALKKQERIRALQRSALGEERLAVALYHQYLSRKQTT